MNILITVNSNYIYQLNILLNSIQESNPGENFNVFILNKKITSEEFEEIKVGLDLNKFTINDIKIPKSEIDSFPVYEKRYPVEIYFRLFATKYLPKDIDRILYLDSDTLVINSLKELYESDFEGNYFIACTHIKNLLHKLNEIRLDITKDELYINTGVLLMNLKELRNIPIETDVINFVKENEKKLILPDQDIISGLYGDKIKLIDGIKYNLGERDFIRYNINNPKKPLKLKWICKNVVILHYYGKNKPWKNNYVGILDGFYKKIEKKVKPFRKGKILILSCGTGGGHNSAAKAIQENLQDKGLQADFVEYLEIISRKIKDGVNNLYIKSTFGNGKVFKNVYHLGELYQKTKLRSPIYQLNSLNKKKLYDYIIENHYDYVVTTHLFAAQALTAIKKDYPIHFMAIATDYVCIPFWEEAKPDYSIIPSVELEEDFIKKGLKKDVLRPIGIPVSKAFSSEYDKSECKNVLGLSKDKKYVLILSGSMGFGDILKIVEELVNKVKGVSYLISCGNNKKLLENIKELYSNNDNVIPIPFTNKLDLYMKASEIVLTKPGGLTTTEIANIRKPFIHTMPIPGCENYNANFFSTRRMSLKSETLEEVVENTKALLNNIELQKELIDNQKKYIQTNSADEISNIIIGDLNKIIYGKKSRKCKRNRRK